MFESTRYPLSFRLALDPTGGAPARPHRPRIRSGVLLAGGPQLGLNDLRRDPVYFQELFPAVSAGDDPHAALRHAQLLSNEVDQCAIRGILDRWRRYANLQCASVGSRDLSPGGARLYVNCKSRGRH